MEVPSVPEVPQVLVVNSGWLAVKWPYFAERLRDGLRAHDLRARWITLRAGQRLRDLPGISEIPALVVLDVEPDPEDIAACAGLVVVAGMTGRDGLAVAGELAERGIPFVDGSIRGRSTSQAELVMALMVCALRWLPQWHTSMISRQYTWPPQHWASADHSRYVNGTVRGKTVVIFGLDLVGQKVAELCRAYGAQVSVVEPLADDGLIAEVGAQRISAEQVASVADIVVVAGDPATPKLTQVLIDQLRGGVVVVTITGTGTGGVDVPALRRRVLDDDLFWATDCYAEPGQPTDPIVGRDNAIHLPGIAGRTHDANTAAADVIVANLARVLRGAEPLPWDCVAPKLLEDVPDSPDRAPALAGASPAPVTGPTAAESETPDSESTDSRSRTTGLSDPSLTSLLTSCDDTTSPAGCASTTN
ncbi:NAD(P)-dependent oxidoreductase [Nocardia sp. XZ_19_369]|uniref:NAD(P)-dependent oxidoreductase n=1 Tax=Nocardia sp. XZ_19_369 TaxID=2769487 RepID=UPI00188DDF2B|nr:NAD(P)-dependent oxidoreductase [Nocardia sp. XZ_19_369]